MSERRMPGDPVPGTLIRELRARRGLTQSELAEMLGVKGGKTVISGWEKEHSSCEGPVAELILLLLGGGSDLSIARLDSAIEKTWTRTGAGATDWRQISFFAPGATRIPSPTFAGLFPALALDAGPHGFPFTERGLPGGVTSKTEHAWHGCIPIEKERQPHYLWLFTDEVQFFCREVRWEADPLRNPHGVVDVGSQLAAAIQTTHFVAKVATTLGLPGDLVCTLRMDLEGVANRALVDGGNDTVWQLSTESARWGDNHATARIDTTLAETTAQPTDVGIKLVAELAGQVSRSLANAPKLLDIVRQRVKDGSQTLAFLRGKI